MLKRDKVKRLYKRFPTDENLIGYKKLRNRCTKLCRDAKRSYIHQNLCNSKSSSNMWKFLNTLGLGKSPSDNNISFDINALNAHFSKSPISLSDQLKHSTVERLSNLAIPSCPSFVFKEVTVKERPGGCMTATSMSICLLVCSGVCKRDLVKFRCLPFTYHRQPNKPAYISKLFIEIVCLNLADCTWYVYKGIWRSILRIVRTYVRISNNWKKVKENTEAIYACNYVHTGTFLRYRDESLYTWISIIHVYMTRTYNLCHLGKIFQMCLVFAGNVLQVIAYCSICHCMMKKKTKKKREVFITYNLTTNEVISKAF
ncbi:hypothetical protein K1T71_008197 [Dendrolimus kikuchii]|uniref:Uncharacterized protein n=1 Tax=Dendrolimus kikuchii TaxID=765133 RepID=A0ACC1CXG3_9NEOP|nr:hypothetical protein K1T71_008197 [Dendrolimus kikuchii]